MPSSSAPSKPAQPVKLFRHALSGHSHRVELFLSLLNLPVELIDIDLLKGAHKEASFLERNPFGQVPVIEDGTVTLYDSNAILIYLAETYDDGRWLPRDPLGAARVQQWLSLASGQIAFGPAAARLVTVFGAKLDHDRTKTVANGLFGTLESILGTRKFAIGDTPTLADVAGYSYIAKAPEGGVSLEPYPNIRAWLKRIEALPGFVPFQETKAGLLAA